MDRGEIEEARVYANVGLDCVKGRKEQPVLPIITPKILRSLGLMHNSSDTFAKAITVALKVAKITHQPELADAIYELRDAIFTPPFPNTPNSSASKPSPTVGNTFELPNSGNELLRRVEQLEQLAQFDAAGSYLKRNRHRFPVNESVWAKSMEYSLRDSDPVDAQRCLDRCMVISYTPWIYIPFCFSNRYTVEMVQKGIRDDNAFPFVINQPRDCLIVGETTEISVLLSNLENVSQFDTPIEAFAISPFGYGVTANPNRGRVRNGVLRFAVTAHRPDQVNQFTPWELRILVTDGVRSTVQTVTFSVTDPSPNQAIAIVTDDHELQDGRAETSIDEIKITLVEKLKKCLRIAEESEASWGICLEANSIRLLDWAASSGGPSWEKLAAQYRNLLIEAVSRGHDIGLHIHDFYDPESPHFSLTLSKDCTKLRSSGEILFTPVSERPFWHRALHKDGNSTSIESHKRTKLGSLRRQLALLESLGRLGDPGFRVSLFRAGSYDIGDRPEHWRDTLFAVREAGILCDSNVTKGRFYHRFDRQTAGYCSLHNPKEFPQDLRRTAVLEICPEYNTEGDFLADSKVLEYYVAQKLSCLQQKRAQISGTSLVTSITHTKFINFRRGLNEYSLDDSEEDWRTIRKHLQHLYRQNIPVVRIRDAVDKLVDQLSPEPVLIRGEAIIEACTPETNICHFVYPLVYLGKGIPLNVSLPIYVAVRPPEWCLDHLVDFRVRNSDDQDVAAIVKTKDEIVFWLTGGAKFELVVSVDASEGIVVRHNKDNTSTLTSQKPYVRAHVSVDGVVYRNVRFVPTANGAQATIQHRHSCGNQENC
ncbi:MAG: hypothetical protein HUU55_11750 [Myxococcales bacterium]|nr:hypothetical protein [Myxococcales bacterium]